MSKETAILNKIFAGFDAGYYDLPPELLARRLAEERVNAALRALAAEFPAADPAAARSRVVTELIEAAGQGDLPTGYEVPFLDAQEVTRRLSAAQSILSEARTELIEADAVASGSSRRGNPGQYLRPAMAAVLDRVRDGVHLAAGVPWSNQRALVMSEKEVPRLSRASRNGARRLHRHSQRAAVPDDPYRPTEHRRPPHVR